MNYDKLIRVASKFEKAAQDAWKQKFQAGYEASDDLLKALTPLINDANQKLGGEAIAVEISPGSSGAGVTTVTVEFRVGPHKSAHEGYRAYVDILRHKVVSDLGPRIQAKHKSVSKVEAIG